MLINYTLAAASEPAVNMQHPAVWKYADTINTHQFLPFALLVERMEHPSCSTFFCFKEKAQNFLSLCYFLKGF